MNLKLDQVLWRTRGARWDYDFVACPQTQPVFEWYDLHTVVFSGRNPGAYPVSFGGIVSDGVSQAPFVATTFLDENNRDSAGRAVAHYFVYFPAPDLVEEGTIRLPSDWGRQVLESVLELWTEAFSDESVRGRQLLQSSLRTQMLGLEGGEPIPLVDGYEIKKKSRSATRRSWAAWALLAAAVLAWIVWLVRRLRALLR